MHPSHLDLRLPDPWHVSPRLAQVFQPGLEDQRPESPSAAASHALPTPRQTPPSRPASVQRPPGVPPARSARRSPRGDRERGRAYLAGCGLRLRLARSRLAAPHGAPLARRLPRRLWTLPLSFSSTLSARKRKRKRPRGGPECAENAERGPAARSGGPGLGSAHGGAGGAPAGAASPR